MASTIARNVDVGQTVASSLQAPTLYILARDLTEMRVNASIDESDIGDIKPKQQVRFRVDAYPNETFTGRVAQVRLQPVVQQNVVSCVTVIDVPNPGLKLKPGMTAAVTIETARAEDVLKVPNAALRFTPADAGVRGRHVRATVDHPPAATMTRAPSGCSPRIGRRVCQSELASAMAGTLPSSKVS